MTTEGSTEREDNPIKFGPIEGDVPIGTGVDPAHAVHQPPRESTVEVFPKALFDIEYDEHNNAISAVRKRTADVVPMEKPPERQLPLDSDGRPSTDPTWPDPAV